MHRDEEAEALWHEVYPMLKESLALDFGHHATKSNGFPNEGIAFHRGSKFNL